MSILDAMTTSITGIAAQSYALNNISGNIANSQTPGFRATSTAFADILATNTQDAGGVAYAARQGVGAAGTIATTGVATNLAIQGDGFFVVKANTGTDASPGFDGPALYTRRGDFAPDAHGYLVNGAGEFLMGGSGSGAPTAPMNLGQALSAGSSLSSVAVSRTGALTGTYADGSTAALGTVTLAHFASSGQLVGVDGGAFLATDAAGAPVYGLAGATLSAGAVEGSNADVATQFSDLIATQQAYAAGTKVLSTTDDMMKDVIGMYV